MIYIRTGCEAIAALCLEAYEAACVSDLLAKSGLMGVSCQVVLQNRRYSCDSGRRFRGKFPNFFPPTSRGSLLQGSTFLTELQNQSLGTLAIKALAIHLIRWVMEARCQEFIPVHNFTRISQVCCCLIIMREICQC